MNTAAPGPVVVVVAGGRGARFDGDGHKLAQPFGPSTVLATTLHRILAAGLPMVVVTTAPLASLAQGVVAARDVVLVPAVGSGDEPLGMGYSIAAGVAARSQASGWMVMPADMPMVRPATFQRIAQAMRQHVIVHAQHRGRRGHPVGFSSELYSELVSLKGDEGARRLLARYPTYSLEIDDPGVLLDVDTRDDLEQARQRWSADRS
ncbi:nucleotidyltransferase family protein [Sphaerotilus hippei]|nr:nucleotidyltransferase family protein [Sphaerotilus hippei]